jgi:hypothetical protein
VKVRAQNANGWGVFSEVNTVGQAVNTLPQTMAQPTFSFAGVSNTSIQISWVALIGEAKGGSLVLILNYEIESNPGSGWSSLSATIDSSLTTYTHSSLTPNTVYQYRIRAINKYGAALSFSPSISILTAQTPDAPDPPTTSIHDIYVQVTWTAPFANYAAITSYNVLIADSSGSFIIENTYCTNPAIVSSLKCYIPMTVLWSTPFTLS